MGKTFECPFKYYRYSPETGYNHRGYDNIYSDDNDAVLCSVGKGPWCANCGHYWQSKKSNERWKREYNRIKATGLAPWLQQKYDPMIVTGKRLNTRNVIMR